MGLVTISIHGQDSISPPMWTAPPGKRIRYTEMYADLETTHSLEDSNLRMASSTAAPHDPGGATAHVSRFSSKLPSL